MHEFLTELGKEALTVARTVAEQSGNANVLPEHLLIGLLSIENGALVEQLQARQVALHSLRNAVTTKHASHSPVQNPKESLELTQVFEIAKEIAGYCEHACVGTDDLFIALLRYNQGPVSEVFKKTGLTYKQFIAPRV